MVSGEVNMGVPATSSTAQGRTKMLQGPSQEGCMGPVRIPENETNSAFHPRRRSFLGLTSEGRSLSGARNIGKEGEIQRRIKEVRKHRFPTQP